MLYVSLCVKLKKLIQAQAQTNVLLYVAFKTANMMMVTYRHFESSEGTSISIEEKVSTAL